MWRGVLNRWWLLVCLTAIPLPLRVWADAVVGGCTQAALEQALAQGGLVRFTNDCSLVLTNTLLVTKATTLSAGGRQVVLSAGTNFTLLEVAAGVVFAADKIHFRGGRAARGGALLVGGGADVRLSNCSFTNNVAAGGNGASGNDGANGANNGGDGTGGKDATPGYGGGIFNLGTLSCSNVVFSGNQASGGAGGSGGKGGDGLYQGGNGGKGGKGAAGFGGAIQNLGVLTVHSCFFVSNSVAGGNGGARGEAGAGAFVGWPGIGGAGAAGYGGAICSSNYLEVVSSTFAGNVTLGGTAAAGGTTGGGSGTTGLNGSEAAGGAIWNVNDGLFTNCTFSGNEAKGGNGGDGGPGSYSGGDGGNGGNGQGGSLANSGTMILVNCTLASGAAIGGTNGAGGAGAFPGSGGTSGKARGGNLANLAGTLWLKNTIAGAFASGGSGYGSMSDGGNNISADRSVSLGATSRVNTDPKLGPLAANGGLTPTMMPLPGSPAANAGNDVSAPLLDQRGAVRPGTGTLQTDIGAVEGIGPAITTQPLGQSRTNGQTVSFTVAAAGDLPLVYRWQLYGTNLPAGTNVTLVITNVAAQHYGPYAVVVSNAFASVKSETANLTQGAGSLTQPQLKIPTAGAGQFTFQWLGQAAQSYRVQYKDTLRDTNWVQVTNLIGTGGWLTNLQPITNVPSRFYRVVSP